MLLGGYPNRRPHSCQPTVLEQETGLRFLQVEYSLTVVIYSFRFLF